MLTPDDLARCIACGKPPVLGMNGVFYREDHIEDFTTSLQRTMRSLEANSEEKGDE